MRVESYVKLREKVIQYLKEGDYETPLKFLKDGVERNDSYSMCILGEFYLNGIGIACDSEKAVELYERAFSLGNGSAAYALGLLYEYGNEEVDKDEEKAFYYYAKGSEMRHDGALGKLSCCYLYGTGIKEDYSKAFQFGLQAAKAGDLNGIATAAICYDDGLGTERDCFSAAYWYRELLSRSEEDWAMTRLADCLANPFETFWVKPTQEMLEEAYHWTCKAVELGNIDAHIILVWFYELGEVVDRDYEVAHRYLQIAADNGSEVATNLLKRYRRNLYGKWYV